MPPSMIMLNNLYKLREVSEKTRKLLRNFIGREGAEERGVKPCGPARRKGRRFFGSERGSAALETGLMIPWLAIAFASVLDFGFSAYGLIATENAARIAATWGAANATNAASLSSQACSYAAPQFTYAPTPLTACGRNLSVSTSTVNIGSMQTVRVAVTYTLNLVEIPGLMPGSLAITRTAQMPIR